MIEVVEVNDIEKLAHYRLVWNSLFAATPNATFFLTFDWFDTYWRYFGHDQKMRVLIIYGDGEPLGILPLCVRREAYRVSKVRVLTYPLDNWSTWYGPIGPNPSATMMAAMQHIRRTPRDWDMLELRWVANEGYQGGKTARALRAANLYTSKEEYQVTSLVDLPATFEEFMASKSHSMRRQFKRTLKSIFVDHEGEYIRHRPLPASEGDGDPGWDVYAACESVAQASWQSHVVHGNTITHDRVREYFHASHAAAARLGMLDVNLLKIDNKPVAFLYGYHHRGNVIALRTGFDATAGDGLGSALMLEMIDNSCQRGDRVVDFGPGEREHKRRLRTRQEATYRITYMPVDSWRSQAVRLTRWAKEHLRRRPATVAAS